MTPTRKEAGRAGERPRHTGVQQRLEAADAGQARRSAGMAPRFDPDTGELQPPSDSPGMLANPWVKQFASADNAARKRESEEESPSPPRENAGGAPGVDERGE